MRSLKNVFFVLALAFVVLTIGFVRSRLIVDQEFGPSSMLATLILTLSSFVLIISYLLADGKHREKVVGFWMVVIASLGTYLAADLVAGMLMIKPLSPQLIPDSVRHHKLVPNAIAKFQQKDFSYVQRNNNMGLRGMEFAAEKPDATYRIITLGDSFTMGKGVEDNQTFSFGLQKILEDELNKCERKFDRVEVLNAGVDSYSPLLSYLYLSQELAHLDPDLVIFGLDNSDLAQEAAYRSIAVTNDSGEIIAVPGAQSKKSRSMRVRDWIENNLYMTRIVLFYTNKWMGHKDLSVAGTVSRANSEIVAHTLVNDSQDRQHQWDDIFESIERMNQFASQHSFEFIMTVYPWPHQVSDELWNPGRETFMTADDVAKKDYDKFLLSMAEEVGIRAVSTYDAFLNYSGKDKLYFDHDMHFTVHGHEVMSLELARLLNENGFREAWCED